MMNVIRLFFARRRCAHGRLPADICAYVRSFGGLWSDVLRIDDTRFVVLDTETTGLDPARDRLLSIGAVAVRDGGIFMEDSFETLIQVDRPPGEDIAVHGILPSQSLAGVDEKTALAALLAYLGNSVIVAHHAHFDADMINRALEKHFSLRLFNRIIDTADLAMGLDQDAQFRAGGKNLSDYSLDALFLRHGISTEDRHTAPGDAFLTAILFVKLLSGAKAVGMRTVSSLPA